MQIQVNSVKVGKKTILHPLTIKAPEGKVVAILGRNGSGKSTLINAFTGHPSYEFNGSAAYDPPIFVGFQKPVEIPEVTTTALLLHLDKLANPDDPCETMEKFLDRYSEEIGQLAITPGMLEGSLNRNISGGENKRLELLQMAVIKPQTILLDEIDTGLDLDMIVQMGKFIQSYIDKYKPAIVIVTHNLIFLEQFKLHSIYILDKGKIVVNGKPALLKKLKTSGFAAMIAEA